MGSNSRVVRIKIDAQHTRVFGPLPPGSYKWKRCYRLRTVMERIYSRVDPPILRTIISAREAVPGLQVCYRLCGEAGACLCGGISAVGNSPRHRRGQLSGRSTHSGAGNRCQMSEFPSKAASIPPVTKFSVPENFSKAIPSG